MINYLNEVQNIFRDVLENESLEITKATCADDIDEWDSLNHIYLIVEIESHFNIKFTSTEIQKWKNVGEMIQALKLKCEA